MRLTLAEVAQCICRRAEDILWHGCHHLKYLPIDAAEHCKLSCMSVKENENGAGIDSIFASWASVLPCGAEIDSRLMKPGYIFFCLEGEKVDGHSFAEKAAEAGACAIVGTKNPFALLPAEFLLANGQPLPPVFLVENVTIALQRLAMRHRDTSLAKVIALTGTAGKTSVKEVLAHVLSLRGATAKSHKNRNNQLGLPISMLQSHADSSFWVLEAGISQAHDMQELAEIVRPDVGLVLNVGTGHTEGLGDKGVAFYKAQIFDKVQEGGIAVYNADFPDLVEQVKNRAEEFKPREIQATCFSTKDEYVPFFVRYVEAEKDSFGFFDVYVSGKKHRVKAPFTSSFGAENVAAIVAVAKKLGFSMSEISEGLASANLPHQRFTTKKINEFVVIDDSYNANPLSAVRMLEAAQEKAFAAELPLYVVFGEMKELGASTQSAHIALGEQLATVNASVIFWKGNQEYFVRKGLKRAGYKGEFYPVGGGQDFSVLLEELALEKGVVLFKGSRSNFLENLVEIFVDHINAVEGHDAL